MLVTSGDVDHAITRNIRANQGGQDINLFFTIDGVFNFLIVPATVTGATVGNNYPRSFYIDFLNDDDSINVTRQYTRGDSPAIPATPNSDYNLGGGDLDAYSLALYSKRC